MSFNDVTPEETIKIAGILETKVMEAYGDKTRFKAEADSLRTALDIMTADRDYWRHRAEAAELERDESRQSEEFMYQQWDSVKAIAQETFARRMERKGQDKLPPPTIKDDAEARHNATVAQFAPPHIRNGS
jgi:hypothetical protein